MTSFLVRFHASKVATLTQVKAIYSQLYFHMYSSVSQPVRNKGIAVFAGQAVFARPLFECLVNMIIVINADAPNAIRAWLGA